MKRRRMEETRLVQLIGFIKDGDLIRFYKSPEWMALRLVILQRDNNECVRCKGRGKYSRAECVHHVKEVKTHPSMALVMDNLMSLCGKCHNEVHGRTADVFNGGGRGRFVSPERW